MFSVTLDQDGGDVGVDGGWKESEVRSVGQVRQGTLHGLFMSPWNYLILRQ